MRTRSSVSGVGSAKKTRQDTEGVALAAGQSDGDSDSSSNPSPTNSTPTAPTPLPTLTAPPPPYPCPLDPACHCARGGGAWSSKEGIFRHVENAHLRTHTPADAITKLIPWLAVWHKSVCPGCRLVLVGHCHASPLCTGCASRRLNCPKLLRPPAPDTHRLSSAVTLPIVAPVPSASLPPEVTATVDAEPDMRLMDLPSFHTIAATRVGTLRHIPLTARVPVARLFRKICLMACSPVGTTRLQGFHLLFAFPKSVLGPLPRGGAKNATARLVIGRTEKFLNDPGALWEEVVAIEASNTHKIMAKHKKRKRGEAQAGQSARSSQDRAVALTREGYFSKAIRALVPSEPSPDNDDTRQRLATLHPSEPPFAPTSPPTPPSAPLFRAEDVHRVVRRFKPSSGPGPSGLRAEHLDELMATIDTQLSGPLYSLLHKMALGVIPEAAAPFFTGANLTAIKKKDGSPRPIACGEILRRLIGKLLCIHVQPDVSKFFGEFHQMGVAVRGGLESTTHLARKLGATWRHDPSLPKAFVKLDFRNAFNSVRRASFLPLVRLHFPDLAPWAELCYATPSHLFFGSSVISSASGVQQGDPLGPLFFSLALSTLVHAVHADWESAHLTPDFHGWYLDDGIIGGPPEVIRHAVGVIQTKGPKLGLSLNVSKCEIISDSAAFESAFPQMVHHPLRNWELLGSPCGDEESASLFIERKIDTDVALIKAIVELDDTQVAYTLLRQCGGQCRANLLARTIGPVTGGFSRLDDAVIHGISLLVGDMSEQALLQTRLPFRHGGLGLRPITWVASLAFGSATIFARHYSSTLSMPSSSSLTTDWPETLALADPVLATTNTLGFLREHLHAGSDFTQRSATVLVDDFFAGQLKEIFETSPMDLRRVVSAGAKNASDWLRVVPSKAIGLAFAPRDFQALCRFRLGLDIFHGSRLCGACLSPADPSGIHATTCTHAALKAHVHDGVVEAIYRLAKVALLRPEMECAHIQVGHHLLRPDLVWGIGTCRTVFDVAVTQPVLAAYDFRRSADSRVETPGRAAEIYGQQKIAKYESGCRALSLKFVPLIFESYGATNPDGLESLRQLARQWCKRKRIPLFLGVPMAMQQVSCALARGIAKCLNSSAGADGVLRDPDEDCRDVDLADVLPQAGSGFMEDSGQASEE